jgi:putative acetyltransferase
MLRLSSPSARGIVLRVRRPAQIQPSIEPGKFKPGFFFALDGFKAYGYDCAKVIFQPMIIKIDDLQHPAIYALLNEHLQNMYELSPPESVHALDLEKLLAPDITFWTAWENDILLGCGALKELDQKHGEIKSMRTPAAHRRKGAGRAILAHIIEVARGRLYERLSLETGSIEAFKPAQNLYKSFGFTYCGPFGDYTEDPNSVFMTLRL